jgi:hypothetical protein
MNNTLTIEMLGDGVFRTTGHMTWSKMDQIKMLAGLISTLDFNAMDLAIALGIAKSSAINQQGFDVKIPVKQNTTEGGTEP